MTQACPECGLHLEATTRCEDYFHELLAEEAQVPGGPGTLAHFFAVASYNLQHPSLFAPEAIGGLHAALVDALSGRSDVAELRRRASKASNGAQRVRRRPEDPGPARPPHWPTQWPMTVGDICGIAPAQYRDRVREWAASVAATLPLHSKGIR